MALLFTFFFVWLTFLTALCRNDFNCNGGDDVIRNLTGYAVGGSNPSLKMNSGFIEVNKTANGSLFYWLVHSMQTSALPDEIPLVIWLNGGPGASSLTALFAENGPFRVSDDGSTLNYFNYSWSTYFHMLYVDQPINTGFSFCTAGQEVQSEDQMGQNFLAFMRGFYECHPELKRNPLYISGESYAGRYIPFIWKWFHAGGIQVAGLAIGNGIYDPFIQFFALPHYAYVNGILDYNDYRAVNATVASCLELAKIGAATNDRAMLNDAANICLEVTNGVYSEAKYGGNIFQYDIRENNGAVFDDITANIAAYLNQTSVRDDIHVYGAQWKSSDGTSAPNAVADALNYDIVLNNSAAIIPEALASETRILFYNGQFDGSVCNNFGNQQCLRQLNYKGEWNELQRSAYFLEELCVGYLKQSSDAKLSYFVVSDAGHLVPYNQPKSILDVMRSWIEQRL